MNKLNYNKLGEVYILLQMDCELKCKVCPYWGIKGACNNQLFKKKYIETDPLNFEIITKFIDSVGNYSPETITLSGGEPLLYEKWVDLAKYINKKGIKVSLSTNGLHLDKYIEEIMKWVGSIQISLGGTKDILNKIRSADYGFDKVIENIKKINHYKKKYNQASPYIRLIYVISDLSYEKIKEFYEYFLEQNIEIDDFYFQHVMYTDKESLKKQKNTYKNMKNTLLWDGFLYDPSKIDTEKIIKQIRHLSGFEHVLFSPKMNENEIRKYYDPKKKKEIKRDLMCSAPWSQVDLYPNGDIMTCPDIVIGNIKKASFENIWHGKKATELREYIEENKRFPCCNSCFYYYVTNEDN